MELLVWDVILVRGVLVTKWIAEEVNREFCCKILLIKRVLVVRNLGTSLAGLIAFAQCLDKKPEWWLSIQRKFVITKPGLRALVRRVEETPDDQILTAG